ncbi:hypothetical protein [Lignipirellula cremea]|uniref:Uncharacterized protein n=1 Tax=Lignipirellula cremea TaxID=2528010 RepID=A0A518DTL1_9BACT|nr:hypothetical protein [Lignipirellula cremea]QDU95174.1 hypothetical protein Pla8534_29860 [Lignipirellula cremea]
MSNQNPIVATICEFCEDGDTITAKQLLVMNREELSDSDRALCREAIRAVEGAIEPAPIVPLAKQSVRSKAKAPAAKKAKAKPAKREGVYLEPHKFDDGTLVLKLCGAGKQIFKTPENWRKVAAALQTDESLSLIGAK